MRFALLLMLVGVVDLDAAPRRQRPLEHYERQVRPGLVVYGSMGWVTVVEPTEGVAGWWRLKGQSADPTYPPYEVHIQSAYIARWLRDFRENKRGRK